MVAYTDKVVLELEAKLSKYHADLLSGQRKFDQVMDSMTKKMKSTESASVAAFERIGAVATSVFGALGVAQVISYADSWTKARNSLAVAGLEGENLNNVLNTLYNSAQKNSVPINAMADLYGKAAQSSDNLGASQKQLTDFADGVGVALRVAGTDAGAASGALLQLGQALGGTKVQAEEFNSINEGARPILMAVAAGLDEAGGSVAKLRQIMLDGELTPKKFFDAFLEGLPKIQEMADKSSSTVAQGFTRISNALTQYIGEMNEAKGGTRLLVEGMDLLAQNFELVANGMLISAGLIMTRYVPSLIAATRAQVAMALSNPYLLLATAIGAAAGYLVTYSDQLKVVESDIANVGDYAAVAWTTMKDLGVQAGEAITETFNGMSEMIVKALEGIGVSWDEVVGFVQSAANKIIGYHVAMFNTAKTLFTSLPAAIADGIVSAMNSMVSLVEAGLQKLVDGVNKVIGAFSGIKEFFGGQTITPVEFGGLGRITNQFEGAGKEMVQNIKDGIVDAFSTDYVGAGVKAATDFATGWQRKANERAANRAISGLNDILNGGAPPDSPKPTPGGGDNGDSGKKGKGRKGGGGKSDKSKFDYEEELKQLRDRTFALNAETEALSRLDPLAEDYEIQVSKIKTEQKLLNEAAAAGIALSPSQRDAISQMAEAYAVAEDRARQLSEQQEKIKNQHEEWMDTQKDSMKGFIKDLASGKDAMEALSGAVQKLADKLLDMALDNLFEGWGKGGGGNIFSSILSLFGGRRAAGGTSQKGLAYRVNEETPNSEIFVPSQNGAILTVPQAQKALADATAARYGKGTQVSSASRQALQVTSKTEVTFNLEGANGDAAIEAAVNRGIREAAPIIKSQAVNTALTQVSKKSRTGSKTFLGIR